MTKLDPYEPYVVGYEGLRQTCMDYMAFLESSDYHPDRLDNYEATIFEAALEFVYGPSVFSEIQRVMIEQDAKR